MTNKNVIGGSVQLPPVEPPVFQTVRLLVDKVIDGSIRAREETVTVHPQIATQWIEAREAEPVVVAGDLAGQPRARSKKKVE